MLVIQHHPHRPATDLGRNLFVVLLVMASTFSGVGASDKPGAVHNANLEVGSQLPEGQQ